MYLVLGSVALSLIALGTAFVHWPSALIVLGALVWFDLHLVGRQEQHDRERD